MPIDVEETLGQELHDVAESLRIPAMPPLPQEPPRPRRHWQPLLVAAAVVLILAGTVLVVTNDRGGREPQPAPSPTLPTSTLPSPTEPDAAIRIPTTPPSVPYVLDQQLYVGGEQVPGSWWSVEGTAQGWLAQRADGTWQWGRGQRVEDFTLPLPVPPVISPNGRYLAYITREGDKDIVTGFDTSFSGEGMGGIGIDPGDPQDGSTVTVRAVMNDGRVLVQGTDTALLWLPFVDTTTVDLSRTAPDQQILDGTATGLLATDGSDGTIDGTQGSPYLAEISNDGLLTPTAPLPNFSGDLIVSPDGQRLVWASPDALGGEVTAIGTLQSQNIDGTGRAILTAPDGWGFRVMDWVWEDDDFVVSAVLADGDTAERMARCSVRTGRCVLVQVP
ncbi:hypothetical protein [Nocardioides sp.]|uniref:hypothetical protein n=1 Tax=Nocardioides sp. TaxID=35761 RepID=UPI003D0B4C7C